MSNNDASSLRGLTTIADKMVGEQVSDNFITFLDWGFVDKGGYFNINLPDSGAYGGSKSTLRLAYDPNYNSGQIWEAFARNWVWETGTSDGSPISISGVTVDSTFHPTTGVGAFAHHYDYPNGRVVFDTAISLTSVVQLEYSTKWINVFDADQIPWFRRMQFDHNRIDSAHYNQTASGEYSELGYTRINLPTVAVDASTIQGTIPHEIGSGARRAEMSITCHVFGHTKNDTRRIADIIADQDDRTLFLFDNNEVAASADYPLDGRGMVVSDPKTYPQLIKLNQDGGYRYRRMRIVDATAQKNIENPTKDLYVTNVTLDVEVLLTKL